MKKWINIIILVYSILLLSVATPTEQGIDYAEISEDIQIMSRIIDLTFQREFPSLYRSHDFFFDGGCQGIYLPSYGVLFITNIQFPVATKEKEPAPKEPVDLWKRIESEVRGERGLAVSSTSGYDEAKVKQLKEEIIRAIGTYAPNIGQLKPEDSITVAVFGKGSIPMGGGGKGAFSFSTSKNQQKEVTVIESPGDAFGGFTIFGATPESTTLIIQVKKKLLTSYETGEIDFDTFLKQAEIVQY